MQGDTFAPDMLWVPGHFLAVPLELLTTFIVTFKAYNVLVISTL